MVIINSDDFGHSPEVNQAIYQSFKNNLISSTSTLVNFDKGLNDATTYTKNNRIDQGAIGIHFNLTDGTPLTNGIKKVSRFTKNGVLATSRARAILRLTNIEKIAVENEFDAQLKKFISNFGFKPSHIDSHHHIHTEWAIFKIVLKIAKKNEINCIRISRTTGENISFKNRVYKQIINTILRFNGFITVNQFGSLDDFKNTIFNKNKDYEIMVHSLLKQEKLTDIDGKSLKEKVNAVFKDQKIILGNYTQLADLRNHT
ncbi:MAG: ChbG/HpnK family deacetylase [Eudoraea sp.]|nr:ChbG/HpnK family deacetylase [Eudoraea sp.]